MRWRFVPTTTFHLRARDYPHGHVDTLEFHVVSHGLVRGPEECEAKGIIYQQCYGVQADSNCISLMNSGKYVVDGLSK